MRAGLLHFRPARGASVTLSTRLHRIAEPADPKLGHAVTCRTRPRRWTFIPCAAMMPAVRLDALRPRERIAMNVYRWACSRLCRGAFAIVVVGAATSLGDELP